MGVSLLFLHNSDLNLGLSLEASQVTQWYRICLPIQEDPLEKEVATHSSILACKISRAEEPGGLRSMESQRAGTRLSTED